MGQRGRIALILGVAAALAVAVVTLVVVLVTTDGDTGPAPGTAVTKPQRPGTDFEQAAFDYVSAVQAGDLAAARRVSCAGFAEQVKLAPLGLRSSGGATVDEVDSFQMNGVSVIGTSDVLVKANVGVVLRDGENAVQWVFAIQPEGGTARVCGLHVLEPTDAVPKPS